MWMLMVPQCSFEDFTLHPDDRYVLLTTCRKWAWAGETKLQGMPTTCNQRGRNACGGLFTWARLNKKSSLLLLELVLQCSWRLMGANPLLALTESPTSNLFLLLWWKILSTIYPISRNSSMLTPVTVLLLRCGLGRNVLGVLAKYILILWPVKQEHLSYPQDCSSFELIVQSESFPERTSLKMKTVSGNNACLS